MASRNSPDAEIRQLFELPPAQFTPARDALAKRLRQEKRAAEAKEVKEIAKPTPSAWAVNLLFAREPEKMAELVAAGQRARVAQREAVSGRGAQALKDALRAARVLADELRWEAGKFFAEQGRAPSRTMVERIAANLQALAFDPELQDVVARGWLERDLEPPGFEVLTGLSPAGAPVVDLAARREARRSAERAPEDEPEKKEKGEKGEGAPEPKPAKATARSSAREKRQEEAARRREASAAAHREREDRKRRRQIEAAQEKVEAARAAASALGEKAREAEKTAAEARRAAQAAERTATADRDKAEKAAERLARAKRELRQAEEVG